MAHFELRTILRLDPRLFQFEKDKSHSQLSSNVENITDNFLNSSSPVTGGDFFSLEKYTQYKCKSAGISHT